MRTQLSPGLATDSSNENENENEIVLLQSSKEEEDGLRCTDTCYPWESTSNFFFGLGTEWCKAYWSVVETMWLSDILDLVHHLRKVGKNWGEVLISSEPREFLPEVLGLFSATVLSIENEKEIGDAERYLRAWAAERLKAGKPLTKKQMGAAADFVLRDLSKDDAKAKQPGLEKLMKEATQEQANEEVLLEFRSKGLDAVAYLMEKVAKQFDCRVNNYDPWKKKAPVRVWQCNPKALLVVPPAQPEPSKSDAWHCSLGESIDLLLSTNLQEKKDFEQRLRRLSSTTNTSERLCAAKGA